MLYYTRSVCPTRVHHREVNSWIGFCPVLCHHHLLSLHENNSLLLQCFWLMLQLCTWTVAFFVSSLIKKYIKILKPSVINELKSMHLQTVTRLRPLGSFCILKTFEKQVNILSCTINNTRFKKNNKSNNKRQYKIILSLWFTFYQLQCWCKYHKIRSKPNFHSTQIRWSCWDCDLQCLQYVYFKRRNIWVRKPWFNISEAMRGPLVSCFVWIKPLQKSHAVSVHSYS